MSGTWSRKRRGTAAVSVSSSASTSSNSSSTPSTARQPLNELPLPFHLQRQQQLLSRSTEKMFEEAELSGVLSLSGRMIKDFPSSMTQKYDISDVVAADLSCNRLADIPSEVCDCRSLETLRLSKNSLRRVSSDISLLAALTYLDLSNNQLTSLPVCIFDLPLEILLLTGNRLETIPREIRQLSPTLTELDLSHNQLKTIPADIALLKMLRVLNLRKNQLDQFPSELCRLSLHVLDLSANRFTHLPLHLRKMKTLMELILDENPLQSPPCAVIAKGREHIFKWMDTASGCGHVPTMRPHHSSSALRSLTLGKSILITGSDNEPVRKTSGPGPIERRGRATRFNTVGGSDSGYGSTADEHRLSHELAPSVLDGINEYPVLSPSPDEGIQVADNENEATSESISMKSQDSSNDEKPITKSEPLKNDPPVENLTSLMKVYDEKMAPIRAAAKGAPLAMAEETSTPKRDIPKVINNNTTKPKPEAPKALDIKNNNAPKATVAPVTVQPLTATTTNSSTATVISGQRPVSKVAPISRTTTAIPKTGSRPITKPVPSKLSPPSAVTAKSSTNMAKPTVNSSAPKRVVPSTMTKSRLTSSAVVRPTPSALPKSRIASESKISASTTDVSPPKRVAAVKATSMEPSTSATSHVDLLRKTMQERISVSLPQNRDGMASALADGIHLCNLVNALRPKAIPSVLNADTATMSPLKAKKNAENFVSACKKLGVPDASLCSPSDIISRRNLLAVAKAVSHLNRIAPPPPQLVSHV